MAYNVGKAEIQPGGAMMAWEACDHPGGDVWWVNATGGTNGTGHGKTPQDPFDTIVYAESQAGADDTIYVMPGHTETVGVTGAAAMTFNLAGLKVIGIGGKTRRPAILIDAYDDTYISLVGAGMLFENFTINAGHSDIASGVIVAADGVTIRNCSFHQNTTNENFLECITDGAANTADRLCIEDCEFFGYDTSNTAGIQIDAAQDQIVIRNNRFFGDFSTASISLGGTVTHCNVHGNWIYNVGADDDSCVKISANSTGHCNHNLSGNNNAAANKQNTTGKTNANENYGCILSEDLSAILDPATA